jgi:hypothetical protein
MLGWYQPLSTYHLPSAPILTVPIPNLPVSVAEKKKERERMMKSPKVRKKNSKREREEDRTSEEGTNPFRNNSRTGRFLK